MISNPKVEQLEIMAYYVKKVERKLLTVVMEEFFSFSMSEEMECVLVGLFLCCIKYVIQCIFADEAECSALLATTWPKTRSSTLKMFRGMCRRFTLRKGERQKKLSCLSAPSAFFLLNSGRSALRAEQRVPLKQSSADCLKAGFHRPLQAPQLLPAQTSKLGAR